jgi:5-methylcytosine-specific restriction endonuclease McrA
MTTKKAQSAGGKATAIILRKQAEDRYYQSPTLCKSCGGIIDLIPGKKVAETRDRKFCNNCFGNWVWNKDGQKRLRENTCPVCGVVIARTSKTCVKHQTRKVSVIGSVTKGELFSKRKNWQSARTAIRNHAKQIFTPSVCTFCGYDKYVEICHIKPVSSFPDSATLDEINSPDNLLGLCPNCHWEFDNLDAGGRSVSS